MDINKLTLKSQEALAAGQTTPLRRVIISRDDAVPRCRRQRHAVADAKPKGSGKITVSKKREVPSLGSMPARIERCAAGDEPVPEVVDGRHLGGDAPFAVDGGQLTALALGPAGDLDALQLQLPLEQLGHDLRRVVPVVHLVHCGDRASDGRSARFRSCGRRLRLRRGKHRRQQQRQATTGRLLTGGPGPLSEERRRWRA